MVDISTQISGLTELGTDLGGFLSAVAPGVGTFIIVMGVFGGIGAIIYAVATMIKKKIN
jgi:hypothetical protein